MDIQSEKEAIIKRFKSITDESLITTFKNLLDSAQQEEMLEASIDRGLTQSANGQVRTHKEVMTEIRNRHKV